MSKTAPEYYETKLGEMGEHHREVLESNVENLYAEKRKASGLAALKIQKRIDQLEESLDWQGANPKKLPFDDLKNHVHQPKPDEDGLSAKYRRRIKNRTTAIRAFCVQCQGGDTAGVRNCPSIACPLHPFRMEKNPFYGFELPKPVIEEVEDALDDDTPEFEDDDEDE